MSTYGTGTYGAGTYGAAGGSDVNLSAVNGLATAGGDSAATETPAVAGVYVMRSRLPLDLFAEIETADGTRYRWDANQAPGSRLRNFSFRTKIGDGFADANGQLARRIELDYPDLGLVNTITLTGADGSVAYEGRLSAMPRELSDTHSIGVTLAGWMSHARDKKFSEVYIDRRLSEWGEMGQTRQASLMTSGHSLGGSVQAGREDDAETALILHMDRLVNTATTSVQHLEAWYRSPVPLAKIYYDVATTGLGSGVGWTVETHLSTDDTAASIDSNTASTGTAASGYHTTTNTTRRTAMIRHIYANTFTGDGVWSSRWRKLAVYGTHGLTIQGTAPGGFYASDVMRDIVSRWCPQLDTSGIQDTSYVIEQLAFTDRAFPYDALLELNKYHLWHLGVWENKRLDFRPYDLTDYDWEIRTDDPGTTFSPQGPSTESLFNGITVQYQDILTGATNVLTPETNPELADTSSTNPWNQHGIDHWDEIALSTPDTETGALYLGVAALADRNAPKTPGTITVRGYIRDRAGNDQPAWKPRAGDTISITNFPNDTPRLIVETDYNDEDKTLRIAVDRPFQLLEAYFDRTNTALGARGLA
jgi:hypothetical protein